MIKKESVVSGSWLLFAAIAFMFVGVAYHPMFFACSIFLLAAAESKRNKTSGVIVAAAGLAFLLIVLGYGVGKDMARRDNDRAAVEVLGRAPWQFIQADVASRYGLTQALGVTGSTR